MPKIFNFGLPFGYALVDILVDYSIVVQRVLLDFGYKKLFNRGFAFPPLYRDTVFNSMFQKIFWLLITCSAGSRKTSSQKKKTQNLNLTLSLT